MNIPDPTENTSPTPEAAHPSDDAAPHEGRLPRLGEGEPQRGPARPINWNLLSSDEAEIEWLELNSWASWLKLTYGLTPAVLPPLWHRHPELVWELSALHRHWLAAYDPNQHASGPLTWHRDFAEARMRLREWVQACGTRIDRDRPTRQTAWPGEPPFPGFPEDPIVDRDQDFVDFVIADVASRRADEEEYYRRVVAETATDQEQPDR